MFFDVTTNPNTGTWSNDLLQSFTPLHNSLAGNVSTIAPKEIEQIKAYGRSRTLLPSLEQLEPWDALAVQRNDLTIEKSLNAASALRPRP
jgi:hypothetical protein